MYAQVEAALGGHRAGRVLVLGAGAGRLVHDLAHRADADVVIALDVNPLLAIVGRRVMNGERVSLYEFPLAPTDGNAFAILRTLALDGAPARAPVHWVLADASAAPFAAESFDTVVTPWLVDVIDEELARFAARINTLLRTGGRWINTGSLVFSQPQRAARYTLDEVLELAAAAGFSAPDVTEQRLPYMCSPASRHGRVESVVTFGATKERGVQVPDCQRDPAWLERHDVPIPALPQFQSDALTMRIYGYLATLIDGRRSIRDIAQELVRERLMTADAAEPAVRSFVGRLLEDAQRRPRF
jgi:SAM-dependent methyltransferase